MASPALLVDPKFTPKYNTTADLYRDLFTERGIDAQCVKRLLMTGNTDLLVESVCLLLDHQSNDMKSKAPCTQYTENHAIDYLGVNKGYLTANSQYGALFYTLCCTDNLDLMDFFRILRSRTDWTSATFREAWLSSEFRAYKQYIVTNMIHIPPNWYPFFFFSKLFELTFSPIEKDGILMIGDEIMNWVLPSIDQDLHTGQLTWATQIFGPFQPATCQEYIDGMYTRVIDASFYSGNFSALRVLLQQRTFVDLNTPPASVAQRPSAVTLTLRDKFNPTSPVDSDLPLALRKALLTRRPLMAYMILHDYEQQIQYYTSLQETLTLETNLQLMQYVDQRHELVEEVSGFISAIEDEANADVRRMDEILTQLADLYQKSAKPDNVDPSIAPEPVSQEELKIVQLEEELEVLSADNEALNDEINTSTRQIHQFSVKIQQLQYDYEYKMRKHFATVESHRIIKDLHWDYLRDFLEYFKFDCCYAQDIFALQLLACTQDDYRGIMLLHQYGVPFKNLAVSQETITEHLANLDEVEAYNNGLLEAYRAAINMTDDELDEIDSKAAEELSGLGEKISFKQLKQYSSHKDIPLKPLPVFASADNVIFDFTHRVHRRPLLRTEKHFQGIPDAGLTLSIAANLDFIISNLLIFNLTTVVDKIIKHVNKVKLISPKAPGPTKEEREAEKQAEKNAAAAAKAAKKPKNKQEKMMEMLTGGPQPPAPKPAKNDDDDDDLFASFSISSAGLSSPLDNLTSPTPDTPTSPTVPVSTRKIVNINDIMTEKNYIAQVCGSHVSRSSTLRYLLAKKSKLNSNSKQNQESNAFLMALASPYADSKSRDEMLILLFEFTSQPDKKYSPLLTQDEYFLIMRTMWGKMHGSFQTANVIAPQFLAQQCFNEWNIYYDNKSELIFHAKRLVPTTKDPMMKMAFSQPYMYLQTMQQLFEFDVITGLNDLGIWSQQSESLLNHHGKHFTAQHMRPYTANDKSTFLAEPNLENNWYGYWGYFDQFDANERAALTSSPFALVHTSVEDEIYMKANPFKYTYLYGYYKDLMTIFTQVIFGEEHIKNAIPTLGAALVPVLRFICVVRCQPLLQYLIKHGWVPSTESVHNVFFAPALMTFIQDINFEEFYKQTITREALINGFNTAIEWKKQNFTVIPEKAPLLEKQEENSVEKETDEEILATLPPKPVVTEPINDADDLMMSMFGEEIVDVNKPVSEKNIDDVDDSTEKIENKVEKTEKPAFKTLESKKKSSSATTSKKADKKTTPPAPVDVKLPPIQFLSADNLEATLTPFSLHPTSTFRQFLDTTDDEIYTNEYPHQTTIQGIYRTFEEHHQMAQIAFEMDCDYYFKQNHTESCEKLIKFAEKYTIEELAQQFPDILQQLQDIHNTAYYAGVPGTVPYSLKHLCKNPVPHNPKKPHANKQSIQIEELDDDLTGDYQTIFLIEQMRLIKNYSALFHANRSRLFSPLMHCFLTVVQVFPDFNDSLRTIVPPACWIAQNSLMGYITSISRSDPFMDPVFTDFLRMTLSVSMRYCSFNMFYQLRNNIELIAKYIPKGQHSYHFNMMLLSNFAFIDKVNQPKMGPGGQPTPPPQTPDGEVATLSYLTYMYKYTQNIPQFLLKMVFSSPGVLAGITERNVMYDLLHSFKLFNKTRPVVGNDTVYQRTDTVNAMTIVDPDSETSFPPQKPMPRSVPTANAVQPIHYIATRIYNVIAARAAMEKAKASISYDFQKRFEKCRSEREAAKLQQEFEPIQQRFAMREQQLIAEEFRPDDIQAFEGIFGTTFTQPNVEKIVKSIGLKFNSSELEQSMVQQATAVPPQPQAPHPAGMPGPNGPGVNPLSAIQNAVAQQMSGSASATAGQPAIGPQINPAIAAAQKAAKAKEEKLEQEKLRQQREYEDTLDPDMILQSVNKSKNDQTNGILGSIFNSTNAWLVTGVATMASAAYFAIKYWGQSSDSGSDDYYEESPAIPQTITSSRAPTQAPPSLTPTTAAPTGEFKLKF